MGRLDEALENYEKAVTFNPSYAEAHCNMGVIYKQKQELEKAIACYCHCLDSNPQCEVASKNIAIAFTDMGAIAQTQNNIKLATEMYEEALYYNFQHATAHYNLAVLYTDQGRIHEAVMYYEQCILLEHPSPEAANNLGLLYKDLGRYHKAIAMYQSAIKKNSSFSPAHNNLCAVYIILGQLDKALEHVSKALELDPNFTEAHNNMGAAYFAEGQLDKAIECYNTCMQKAPESRGALHNRLLLANYQGQSPQEVFIHHQRHAGQWEGRGPSPRQSHMPHQDVPCAEQGLTLRVGYLVPDLFSPSMKAFFHGILPHHSDQCQIFCYTNILGVNLGLSQLDRLSVKWISVYQQSAEKIAHRIYEDRIDVLVDLSGHSTGNRLDVFLHKPAPIQIAYLGSMNTRGLTRIDYLLCDAVMAKCVDSQHFTEKLLVMDRCLFGYSPCHDIAPATTMSRDRLFTFGYSGDLASLTEDVIRVWSELLMSVPHSCLRLRSVAFNTPFTRGHILQRFEALHVPPSRLLLQGIRPAERLGALQDFDLFLDPWPVGSLLSLSDALSLGIPVVSMKGRSFAHNIGMYCPWPTRGPVLTLYPVQATAFYIPSK